MAQKNIAYLLERQYYKQGDMGRDAGDALVESIAFNRRVMGLTPALAAM